MPITKQLEIRNELEKENIKYKDILRVPNRIYNKLNKDNIAYYAGFIITKIKYLQYNYVMHTPKLTKDKLVYYETSYFEDIRIV